MEHNTRRLVLLLLFCLISKKLGINQYNKKQRVDMGFNARHLYFNAIYTGKKNYMERKIKGNLTEIKVKTAN